MKELLKKCVCACARTHTGIQFYKFTLQFRDQGKLRSILILIHMSQLSYLKHCNYLQHNYNSTKKQWLGKLEWHDC